MIVGVEVNAEDTRKQDRIRQLEPAKLHVAEQLTDNGLAAEFGFVRNSLWLRHRLSLLPATHVVNDAREVTELQIHPNHGAATRAEIILAQDGPDGNTEMMKSCSYQRSKRRQAAARFYPNFRGRQDRGQFPLRRTA